MKRRVQRSHNKNPAIFKEVLEVIFALSVSINVVLLCIQPLRIYIDSSWRSFLNANLSGLRRSSLGIMLYRELAGLFTFHAVMTFIVLSSLALIYLLNMDIINPKIRHFFREGFSLSAAGVNADYKTVIPAPLNIFFAVFSCFLFVFYFYFIFSQTAAIHPETYHTFARQLRPGAFIRELIPAVFNKVNFEGLGYRPRVMSFLVDYINVNSVVVLNRIFPFWGMRLLFNVISVPLTVFAFYRLLDYFFKTMPAGLKLFLSVLPLFSASFMLEAGGFYRSGNHLSGPLSLFLLYYFFKNSGVSFEKKNIRRLLLPVFLVFLCTLFSEQLLAVTVYFAFSAVLLSVIKRKVYCNAVVFTGAAVCFLFWFHAAGRYLFGIFTTIAPFVPCAYGSVSFLPAETQAMTQHVHRFGSFLLILSPGSIPDLVWAYFELIRRNITHFSLIIILSLVCFVINGKKQHSYDLLQIPVFILLLSFLLSCAVALGHFEIVLMSGLLNTRYQITAFFLFYIGSVYLFFHLVFSHSNKILTSVIFMSLCLVVFVSINTHTRKVDSIARTGSPPHLLVLPKDFIEEFGDHRIIELHNFIIENNINQNFVFHVDRRSL